MTDRDAQPVRPGEDLDWHRVEPWLRDHLPAAGLPASDLAQAMQVEQFPGGHSNLTYLIRFGDTELVLRRPPLGPVPPTAHDMAREYRWLTAIHPVYGLAPRAWLLCDEVTIAGAVFYVMERRHGLVVRHDEPPILAQPGMRRAVSGALVDALAALHRLDVDRAGLAHLGKPAGFVERQVRGWTDRWHRSQTHAIDDMDGLARWLVDRLPPQPDRPAVVHGDFKLDNVMLDPADPARLVAVFDWEMSALGDPLVDLGILLAYWVPSSFEGRDALTTVTGRPGYFTRDELVRRYADATGRDLTRLPYYEVFALFKIAVVIQQIYYRYVNGQTSDARFAVFGARVESLAQRAAAVAAGL